jgi:uncharacterized protein (TIGR04255 family)
MSAAAKTVRPDRPLPTSDSLFPDVERVVYGRSPLVSVVAQLRFPRILRIEGSPPADFQERIRDKFPLVEQGPAPLQLPLHLSGLVPQAPHSPQMIPPDLMQLLNANAATNLYRFLTEDRKTTVTLSPEALSLNTSGYEHWGEFKKLLTEPLRALIDIYKPTFFTRVGLRYINLIDREQLQIANVPWSHLLNPAILGELALPEFEAAFESGRRQLRLNTVDMIIFMQHGTAFANNLPNAPPRQTYAIDCDYSSAVPHTVISDAQSRLDDFNNRAFRAFRWAISNDLHLALQPKPASPQV